MIYSHFRVLQLSLYGNTIHGYGPDILWQAVPDLNAYKATPDSSPK